MQVEKKPYQAQASGAGPPMPRSPPAPGRRPSTAPGCSSTSRLAALLGPTRAAVLLLLAAPHSTGDVAARLALATGTASYHLTTLRNAGLATAERADRRLLYQRTRLGDQLVAG